MRDLKPCPKCGSKRIVYWHIVSARLPWWYTIECDDCFWCSKTKLFLFRAKLAWNRGIDFSKDFDHKKDDFSKEVGQ